MSERGKKQNASARQCRATKAAKYQRVNSKEKTKSQEQQQNKTKQKTRQEEVRKNFYSLIKDSFPIFESNSDVWFHTFNASGAHRGAGNFSASTVRKCDIFWSRTFRSFSWKEGDKRQRRWHDERNPKKGSIPFPDKYQGEKNVK